MKIASLVILSGRSSRGGPVVTRRVTRGNSALSNFWSGAPLELSCLPRLSESSPWSLVMAVLIWLDINLSLSVFHTLLWLSEFRVLARKPPRQWQQVWKIVQPWRKPTTHNTLWYFDFEVTKCPYYLPTLDTDTCHPRHHSHSILIYPQFICTAVTIQQHCKKFAFKPKRGHESTTGIHLIDEWS